MESFQFFLRLRSPDSGHPECLCCCVKWFAYAQPSCYWTSLYGIIRHFYIFLEEMSVQILYFVHMCMFVCVQVMHVQNHGCLERQAWLSFLRRQDFSLAWTLQASVSRKSYRSASPLLKLQVCAPWPAFLTCILGGGWGSPCFQSKDLSHWGSLPAFIPFANISGSFYCWAVGALNVA